MVLISSLPDDVKEMLPHVLGHRLILRPESRLRKKTIGGVLARNPERGAGSDRDCHRAPAMKWILGIVALLALGLALQLSQLIYAMYVLLGVLLLSRFFSRVWMARIEARRFRDEDIWEIGGTVEVKVAIQNSGYWAVPWLLIEDAPSRDALTQSPPRLKARGARVALIRLAPGEVHVLSYSVQFHRRGYYQLGPLLAKRAMSLDCTVVVAF